MDNPNRTGAALAALVAYLQDQMWGGYGMFNINPDELRDKMEELGLLERRSVDPKEFGADFFYFETDLGKGRG